MDTKCESWLVRQGDCLRGLALSSNNSIVRPLAVVEVHMKFGRNMVAQNSVQRLKLTSRDSNNVRFHLQYDVVRCKMCCGASLTFTE